MMDQKLAYEYDSQAALPGLSVVSTPIGHLRDITLRALDVLAGADLVLCEDKRITTRLLSHYGLRVARLETYHDRNARERRPKILEALRNQAKIALVSDAGTPLISDPGYRLVCACIKEGIPLWPIPGASAPIAALSVSGMASDQFFFVGFSPARKNTRQRFFKNLAGLRSTVIFFETPHRLKDSLYDMQLCFGVRKIALMREITKYHQQYVFDSVDTIIKAVEKGEIPARGEIVILVEAIQDKEIEKKAEAEALLWLEEHLPEISLRTAVEQASKFFSLPKNLVYRHALDIRKKGRQ